MKERFYDFLLSAYGMLAVLLFCLVSWISGGLEEIEG